MMPSASEHHHGPLERQERQRKASPPRWGVLSFPLNWREVSDHAGTLSNQCAWQLAPLPNQNLPWQNPLPLPIGQRGRALCVVPRRSNLLPRTLFTTSKYLLSAPAFQEIPGNPVKRETHRVTISERGPERAVEECDHCFQDKSPVSHSVSQPVSWTAHKGLPLSL